MIQLYLVAYIVPVYLFAKQFCDDAVRADVSGHGSHVDRSNISLAAKNRCVPTLLCNDDAAIGR